ncbi:MAG TPA: YihY/virulence factor BrkB family protein [Zeimonas sp.]
MPRIALPSLAPTLAAAVTAFGAAFAARRLWSQGSVEPLALGNVARAASAALDGVAIPGESARQRRKREARRAALEHAQRAPAPPRGVRGFYRLLVDTVSSWIEDYAPSMGAALSYYTLFSLAPLLLIVVSVAGLVFGGEAARGEVFGQLQGLLGDDGAAAVQSLLQSVEVSGKGPLGSAIGIVLLAVGATTVFGELQSNLDRIWRSPRKQPSSGIWALVRTRLLSFGLILSLGFLLIVSLVASAAIAALGKWWSPVFGGWEWLAQIINFVVSFGLLTAMFTLIYKLMPSVDIAWRDVLLGSAVTAALFTIGKWAIGLYIGKSGIASGFGAASSIVVLMVWVYYSAQIFLLGAEFTWVYAGRYGSRAKTRNEGSVSGV